MAIACLRFFTSGPFLLPLCSSPCLNSCIDFSTLLTAPGAGLGDVLLLLAMMQPSKRKRQPGAFAGSAAVALMLGGKGHRRLAGRACRPGKRAWTLDSAGDPMRFF